ncbi:hypothetical protein [Rhodococcus sp. APC 3903]|uniref:AraC-like ligand-binding domain-containing protein n=1 Tax=Rhodococcus sp. APC 3903 TaxID=3035193 RepID=UPI0033B6DF11
MEWSADCEQLLVHIPRGAVQSTAESEPGPSSDPVVLHPLVDVNAPTMSSWMRIVHLACDEAEREIGSSPHPMAARHFEHVSRHRTACSATEHFPTVASTDATALMSRAHAALERRLDKEFEAPVLAWWRFRSGHIGRRRRLFKLDR